MTKRKAAKAPKPVTSAAEPKAPKTIITLRMMLCEFQNAFNNALASTGRRAPGDISTFQREMKNLAKLDIPILDIPLQDE